MSKRQVGVDAHIHHAPLSVFAKRAMAAPSPARPYCLGALMTARQTL